MEKTISSNYISAWFDWDKQEVIVLERDIKTGERFLTNWKAPYYFYVPAENGEFESIFGDKLCRLDFSCREEYDAAIRQYPKRFESDIIPLDRVLMDNYYGRPTPPINFAFFDIEVDYKKSIGFASPQNPYAPINAITIFQSWTKEFITLAVAPPQWNGILPSEHEMRNEFDFDVKPNIFICKDEMELLLGFLDVIQEADIISGWNSDFFDIPYIVKRIELVLGKQALASLGHPDAPLPKERLVERFGTNEITYRISGRNHLDYLQLFQKFTFEGRTSYSLANIANEELNVPKLEYDGTLEELYNNDFKHFLMYNIRDVEILKLLDDKFKFIALVNQMAHENTVLFESILGTVKYVETGIINHAHNVLKKIVNDKNIHEHEKVEGAVVLNPRIGLHEWIGSVDINSLYPNTIRSLNISPEKIIGQFTNTLDEEDWEAIFRKDPNKRCCLILESGEQLVATAEEWSKVLIENKWAISAYGTVFDQSCGRGVIPDILGFWYNERKRLQAEKKRWEKEVASIKQQQSNTIEYHQKLNNAIKNVEHYDLLQLTKKISMNSLYGSLLNIAFRFGDKRLGASVTATGRKITTHMIETIGYLLTGEHHPLIKKRINPDIASKANSMNFDDLDKLPAFPMGTPIYYTKSPAIIYGDTDSCYYKTFASNKQEAIEIADTAAIGVNESFPEFMRKAFNCQPGFDNLIKVGREIVGIRGLFQAKKKYMIKVVDQEGFAVDKMKSMGSEIKKADTPKIIQDFLKQTVDMILEGNDYNSIADFVNSQRKKILQDKKNVFLLGVAKQVNNLDKFYAEYLQYEKSGIRKAKLPGHVRAAINYNELLELYDPGAKPIRPGDKILLYYVKPNQMNIESIAMPAELSRFPKWFEDNFSVDIIKTESKMFDNKLTGIFSAIGHDVPSPQTVLINKILEF